MNFRFVILYSFNSYFLSFIILFFGYRCEAPCGVICPPCKAPCEYRYIFKYKLKKDVSVNVFSSFIAIYHFSCSHQKCSNLCGEECMPCKVMMIRHKIRSLFFKTYLICCKQRPCEWICPHSRCQHACSDLCNREACNLPCMKTLRCGHKCIGTFTWYNSDQIMIL